MTKLISSKTETKPVAERSLFKNLLEKRSNSKETLPENYEKILNEAIEFQFKADSLIALLVKQKKELEKLTGSEKSAMKVRDF